MKSLIKYEALDGSLHDSVKDAKRHIEAIYANKLASVAHKMVQLQKYSAIGDFIDENLALFAELQTIKNDLVLTSDDNEGV